MTQDLETLAAHAVYIAALFERAVHGSDNWALQVGNVVQPAVRTVEGLAVVFTARFPNRMGDPSGICTATLIHEGETVGARDIIIPEGRDISLSWEVNAIALADTLP